MVIADPVTAVIDGVQNGPIPEAAAQNIVDSIFEDIGEHKNKFPLLRAAIKRRAKRNLGSKVPAVRRVAGALHRRFFHVQDATLPPATKKLATNIWSRVRQEMGQAPSGKETGCHGVVADCQC